MLCGISRYDVAELDMTLLPYDGSFFLIYSESFVFSVYLFCHCFLLS